MFETQVKCAFGIIITKPLSHKFSQLKNLKITFKLIHCEEKDKVLDLGHFYAKEGPNDTCYISLELLCSTVKSRFNEWPPSAPFHYLNRDFTLNRDFWMWKLILVTRFHSLNWDFALNRDLPRYCNIFYRGLFLLLAQCKDVAINDGDVGWTCQGEVLLKN